MEFKCILEHEISGLSVKTIHIEGKDELYGSSVDISFDHLPSSKELRGNSGIPLNIVLVVDPADRKKLNGKGYAETIKPGTFVKTTYLTTIAYGNNEDPGCSYIEVEFIFMVILDKIPETEVDSVWSIISGYMYFTVPKINLNECFEKLIASNSDSYRYSDDFKLFLQYSDGTQGAGGKLVSYSGGDKAHLVHARSVHEGDSYWNEEEMFDRMFYKGYDNQSNIGRQLQEATWEDDDE